MGYEHVCYEEEPPSKIKINKLYRELFIYISAWIYGVILFSIYFMQELEYIKTTKNLLLIGIFIAVSYVFIFLIIFPDLKFIESLKNYVVVSPTKDEFRIDNRKISLSAIKKVIVDSDKLQILIYLNTGKILKYAKDSHSMFLMQFQKCMDTLGIEFGIIRRTGKLWKSRKEVIRIKTTEDYRQVKHKERYRKWVENQKGTNNVQNPPGE